jgi:Bax protein
MTVGSPKLTLNFTGIQFPALTCYLIGLITALKSPNFLILLVCLVAALSLAGCKDKTYRVKTDTIALNSLRYVDPLSDSLVRPFLYTNVLGFDSLEQEEAKSKFVAVMLPAILVAKHERETDQFKFKRLMEKEEWKREDSAYFDYLKDRYQIRKIENAMFRMQTLPNSMVLAQAAVESGWGKSRFFKEAKNVFGIWSFSESDQRVEAHAVRGDQKVFLRAYPDLSGSVRDYFDVLSRSNAFRGLRIIRETTDDPFTLIPYLKNYSERKSAYTKLIRKIIEQNDLTRYDSYAIHPEYLEEED